ncbi:hypothetical protein M3226_24740 [Neobacillus cucumis]|uniref:Gfo/Idh/MocA family protein n=1 Tax=Neobacillus cucumis TaxID=1740721 RepID=UPI00204190E1|nr:hypothetical protein [Neobacillus cucumis]MCM3728851.1 hypothetical protein [Neobacillus cucumis]
MASTTEFKKVDVDDASIFMTRFKNRALGTLKATRFAGGNKNVNKFEISGRRAPLN